MIPPDLTRRLAARKLAAARLATDLILDCDRAASGRNGKRADPARWTETDWRQYLRAAPRSPASSRLPPLYHAIGDIEAALCDRCRPAASPPIRLRRAHPQVVIKGGST